MTGIRKQTAIDAEEQHKTCTGCKVRKPFIEFYRNPNGANGLTPQCKKCVGATNKKNDLSRREREPERYKELARKRMERHYYKDLAKSREYQRLSAAKRYTPELRRRMMLKEKYGMSVEQWDALFESQGCKCAICGTDDPGTKSAKWNTDHDHRTGKVRGILCCHCNRLLGAALDDITFLTRAAKYLGVSQGVFSGKKIRKSEIITPHHQRTTRSGMSFGESYAGYDIRIAQTLTIPPKGFCLGSSIEYFQMPNDCIGFICDKSTHARRGLSLFNSTAEPGWRGYLTLELFNASDAEISLNIGDPIAQIVFIALDEPTEQPYSGKYQDQPNRPVAAILEGDAA